MPRTSTPDPAYPEYANLITEAQRLARGFVDPGVLATAVSVATTRGDRWCQAVLGHYFHGVHWLTYQQVHLLILADRAGVDPPDPQWILDHEQVIRDRDDRVSRSRELASNRDRDAWAAAAEQVTVALVVHTNTHVRTRRGVPHYLGHAVPTADVYTGTSRVRTHRAGRALCETETRGKPLGLNPEPAPDGTPVTCDRCLLWAPRVRAAR